MPEKLTKLQTNKYLLKELKNPPVWTEEQKKIIAWSICWDGCISLVKSKHKGNSQGFRIRPIVDVSNTRIKLLQTLQKIFQIGVIRENKTCYHLEIHSFEECLYILSEIFKFLPAKQKQAFYTIQFIKSRLSHRKGREIQHIYTLFEIECRRKVHVLNQKRWKRK